MPEEADTGAFNDMPVSYLRVSVTDRCNLRCLYCTIRNRRRHLPREEILSFEEMLRVVSLLAAKGVHTVRITGGEPLMRKDVVEFVRMLSGLEGIWDLSMTTNGVLLGDYAEPLKDAGLRRVNVSLDTLRPERFRMITGLGNLDQVFEGTRKAQLLGLSPVKLNVVCLKGVNDDEVCDFVRFGMRRRVIVRFIEYMPIGSGGFEFVPTASIMAVIEKEFGRMERTDSECGVGPSEYFRIGDLTTLGFISPMSRPACSSCNRLRLRADGRMYPCLMRSSYVDLKSSLRENASSSRLEALLDYAISLKELSSPCEDSLELPQMHMIGG